VDVGPGPVALRQAAGLYVFPNGVAVVEITGAGLRDWLERGASMFRTLVPGLDDQPLIDRPSRPTTSRPSTGSTGRWTHAPAPAPTPTAA
jgi:2',3'-cyclic-nucleotide 2'-phosphodiesterase (5'-nucleotidase family)